MMKILATSLVVALLVFACGSDESKSSFQVSQVKGYWKVPVEDGVTVFEVKKDGKVYQISPAMNPPKSPIIGTLVSKNGQLVMKPNVGADLPEGSRVVWNVKAGKMTIKKDGKVVHEAAGVVRLSDKEWVAMEQNKKKLNNVLPGNWNMVEIETYRIEGDKWTKQKSDLKPEDLSPSYESEYYEDGRSLGKFTTYNPKQLLINGGKVVYNGGAFESPLSIDPFQVEISMAASQHELDTGYYTDYTVSGYSSEDRLYLERRYNFKVDGAEVEEAQWYIYERVE